MANTARAAIRWPLLFKVCCCMVLSTNDNLPNNVDYARTAVNLLNTEVHEAVDAAAFPRVKLGKAERLLKEAEAHYAIDMKADRKTQAEKVLAEGSAKAQADDEVTKKPLRCTASDDSDR